MTFVMIMLAVLLYTLRPRSFRRIGANSSANNDKPPPPATQNDVRGCVFKFDSMLDSVF